MTDTAITVHRSLGRILIIGLHKYRLFCQDWYTESQCEEAASMCAVLVNNTARSPDGLREIRGIGLDDLEIMLGNYAREKLGIDDLRPYAFSVILEALP